MNEKKSAAAPLHGTAAVITDRQSREHSQYTPGEGARQELERPSYFAVLPAKVRYDEELRPNAKLLYAEITALSNARGYCWISNERLGGWFGLSPKTVGSLIQQLAQRGYLAVELIRDENQAITGRRLWIDRPGAAETAPPILKNEDTPLKIEDRGVLKNEEKNNTRDMNNTPHNPPRGDELDWKPERFEAFWRYYPAMGGRSGGRKPAKARARKAWNKLRADDNTIREMATALQRQKNSEQWQAGVGIPYASTWLNGRMWEEDFEPPAPKAPAREEGPAWI